MSASPDASAASAVHVLDDALLHAWPLPMPDGDKEDRGHVLVLGGSREMPGAVSLAAPAALHAGAGKLTIATGQSVAHLVALAMPEARVPGLAETPSGGFQPSLVLTPRGGAMAHLTGRPEEQVRAAPAPLARQCAAQWNAVVALEGAVTHIAAPDGTTWRHEGGNVGLAVSCSGGPGRNHRRPQDRRLHRPVHAGRTRAGPTRLTRVNPPMKWRSQERCARFDELAAASPV